MPNNAAPQQGLDPLLTEIASLRATVNRLASMQRPPVAPVISGVGKVTVTDDDFDFAPSDGAIVVVVNTTDSTRRLAVRESNAWVVFVALS